MWLILIPKANPNTKSIKRPWVFCCWTPPPLKGMTVHRVLLHPSHLQRIKQQQQQQQQQQQNNKHTNKLSGFPEFSYNHSYSLAAESGTVRIVSYARKQHNCLLSVRAWARTSLPGVQRTNSLRVAVPYPRKVKQKRGNRFTWEGGGVGYGYT